MTSEPRAFLALDTGAATIAAALIGRVGGRWRLIGSLTMPAGADVEAVVRGPRRPRRRRPIRRSRPPSTCAAAAPSTCRGSRSPATRRARMAVVAASERALAPLVATAVAERLADRRGAARSRSIRWHDDAAARGRASSAILVGAGDPPAADERRALGELTALVAAAAEPRGPSSPSSWPAG